MTPEPPSLRDEATWRAAVAVIATTLLLVVDGYHVLWGNLLLSRTVLYLLIPLGIVLLVFREPPARYGFQLGNWRVGLAWTLGACAGLAAVMAFVARTPAFREYYGAAVSHPFFWLADGIELLGWEFFFRGFLLFALYRACGPLAWLLQAVPFTLAHMGKPELETLSCIFGGTALGYIAWRARSFLYPFLIHWFLASFTAIVAGR
ncbi:MAG: CPBP family intramembrane glutamic endopeptidase [Anaerolineae bacterium]|nr:CPBP family intramembrane metalloprotease [Anaerolineae bacterium]MCX8067316.1 CPBP family intramembrane metalloprotease [Anaerolineae bacterium]MDW7991594.1 CPBP family intramembrane glutamic endopeptidase [Anaerolineae bacterium]